jgi:hypothetical protein
MGSVVYSIPYTLPSGEKRTASKSHWSCFGNLHMLTAPSGCKLNNRLFLSTTWPEKAVNKWIKLIKARPKSTMTLGGEEYELPTIRYFKKGSTVRYSPSYFGGVGIRPDVNHTGTISLTFKPDTPLWVVYGLAYYVAKFPSYGRNHSRLFEQAMEDCIKMGITPTYEMILAWCAVSQVASGYSVGMSTEMAYSIDHIRAYLSGDWGMKQLTSQKGTFKTGPKGRANPFTTGDVGTKGFRMTPTAKGGMYLRKVGHPRPENFEALYNYWKEQGFLGES